MGSLDSLRASNSSVYCNIFHRSCYQIIFFEFFDFLLYLWFYNWAKPYKPSMKILFHLDILSYICLCFNLVSNIIRAIVYVYSLPSSQYPIDKALDVTRYLEFIFSPLWPLIVYFIVVFTMKNLKKY